MVDFAGAIPMYVPIDNVFTDRNGYKGKLWVVIHKTAGMHSAQQVAQFFATVPDKRSSHYVVGPDGVVVQCVAEQHGAGANCCLEPGHDSFWPTNINLNLCTISIEHVDPAIDNSTPVPDAQQQASFQLVADICRRNGIAASDIYGHNSIDPLSRAHCPGNYPMDELRAFVQAQLTPVPLSASGEVATFVDVSRLEVEESAYECAAMTAALCRHMGEPTSNPTGRPGEVDALSDTWSHKLRGHFDHTKKLGMSIAQLHTMLDGIGLKWSNLPIDGSSQHAADIAAVKSSLYLGKPVLICGHEGGFYDLDLGASVSYLWTPTGNHCVLATGIAHDGNLLVRDRANADEQGIRPGPRRYDGSKMVLISGTEVDPHWIGGFPMGVPQNWKDDSETLTAPNGIVVAKSFRKKVLQGWDPTNVPLEVERQADPVEHANPSIGAGAVQTFANCRLGWTPTKGVYFIPLGDEMLFLEKQETTTNTPSAAGS